MRNKLLITGILGLSIFTHAQQSLVTQYTDELYQLTDNGALGGTARFRGLSGAMGALGGDISATTVNPASGAVFLQSEASISIGLNSAKIDHGQNKFSDTKFNLSQIGGTLYFDELNSEDWKNISLGINYQRLSTINERFNLDTNTTALDDSNLRMTNYYADKTGESSVTNLTVAANYKNNLYIGAGLNIHSYESNSYGDFITETNDNLDETYEFYKNDSKNFKNGSGASVSLGVIGKVNQNLRLGASYRSPIWSTDVEETVIHFDKDQIGYFENLYVNDMISSHKLTGSAAVILGKNGLISADYTYTDYSTAKFKPQDTFSAENQYIENYMKGTSSLRIGAEMRLNEFRLRGGFRYEETPFKEIDLLGDGKLYQPFGDLTGFSAGIGYDFKSFYIDAAYDFYKRDRNVLVSGNFYDYKTSYGDDFYSLDTSNEGSGYNQVVKDINQQQGNVTLSIGFRF